MVSSVDRVVVEGSFEVVALEVDVVDLSDVAIFSVVVPFSGASGVSKLVGTYGTVTGAVLPDFGAGVACAFCVGVASTFATGATTVGAETATGAVAIGAAPLDVCGPSSPSEVPGAITAPGDCSIVVGAGVEVCGAAATSGGAGVWPGALTVVDVPAGSVTVTPPAVASTVPVVAVIDVAPSSLTATKKPEPARITEAIAALCTS